MKRNKSKNTVYLVLAGLLTVAMLFANAGVIFFYRFKTTQLETDALEKQHDLAREIVAGLEDYLRVARQLSRSSTTLLGPMRQDKTAVEVTLKRLLESAPEDLIYGMGVWYEPRVFDPNQELFGPYAHRGGSPGKGAVLTYEWNTLEYYYPRHPWYLAGRDGQGKTTVFTEPYFDTNLVYMTASRAFFDEKGIFAGVTSVDMVLPLLHDYVASFNTESWQIIYLTTRRDKLFVHPREDELLRIARREGRDVESILDISHTELAKLSPDSFREKDWIKIGHEVPGVNWKVWIKAERSVLLKELERFQQRMTWFTVLLWLAFFGLLLFLSLAHRTRARNQLLREELAERKRREGLLKEMNEALERKVQARTADLEIANQEIKALNERLKEENLRLGAEVEVTRRLQQMLLPRSTELRSISELDIAGFMQPACEVGGDYYDVLTLENRVLIGMGDVTGHGLESGVLMLMVQTAVRGLMLRNLDDLSLIMQLLNQTVYANAQRMGTDKNLTLVLLEYHQGRLKICGQHEEVLVVRREGFVEAVDTVDLGFMMGLVEDVERFIHCMELRLEIGDGVVLYTDGITEAQNPEGEQFGVRRLCESACRAWADRDAARVQQAIMENVSAFTQNPRISDDMTLVVFKRAC